MRYRRTRTVEAWQNVTGGAPAWVHVHGGHGLYGERLMLGIPIQIVEPGYWVVNGHRGIEVYEPGQFRIEFESACVRG